MAAERVLNQDSADRRTHLQHQPQLPPRQVVGLEEHAVKLHHIGVVGQRPQDVVLCLDLLIHIL